MRVLLVHPEFPATYWGFEYSLPLIARRATLPPLGLVSLAALLPAEWSLRLVDMNVQTLTDDDILAADVVFTGGMLIQEPSAQQVIARAHRLGRRVVVGGPACTTSPEKFADADIVFRGEAEGRIPALIAALEAAEPHTVIHPCGARPGLTGVPVPRFDLLERRAYKAMSIQYSRGCPFSCEFCDIIEIYGRLPRVKTNAQILAEFDALYALGHRGTVFMVDDNFIGNKRSVRTLLPALTEWQSSRGFPFALFTEASVNLAGDAALVEAMVAAGFTTVFLGIETPSEASLLATKKKQNVDVDLNAAVEAITRAGMEVMAGFIVGFDTDGPEIFELQRKFIASVPVPLAMIGVLIALPDTGLWRRLAGEKRLRADSNGDAFGRPNFTPSMDERTLVREYAALLAEINSPDAYYARAERLVDLFGDAGPSIPLTFDDVMITLRTIVGVGMVSPRRGHFWKLVARSLRRPHTLRLAITHAIQAEHAIRYTLEQVLPRLRESVRAVEADRDTAMPAVPPPYRASVDGTRTAPEPNARRTLPLAPAN